MYCVGGWDVCTFSFVAFVRVGVGCGEIDLLIQLGGWSALTQQLPDLQRTQQESPVLRLSLINRPF